MKKVDHEIQRFSCPQASIPGHRRVLGVVIVVGWAVASPQAVAEPTPDVLFLDAGSNNPVAPACATIDRGTGSLNRN
ncbi:hypothetical protein [Nocardia arthritidis]|uniref:Uncharacterized protein n=1 Tax=Nocardia arthritidis TaxID=228602 RepID=A0A6G9YKZ2_9NOCA|nr:hypothetical protein [Nocardia arthritidis]QIS13975.1 hypothetical protein F5544_30660 [Nocardia arthritidis]